MVHIQSSEQVKKTEMCERLNRVVGELNLVQTHLLLRQALALVEAEEPAVHSVKSLSKRELEVLVLVANGYNRKNIAETLGISINTAARHIANMYSKLGISSVAEATGLAYSSMLVGSGSRMPLS